MTSNLLDLLGYDESDPEVQAARRDAAELSNLIESLVLARKERGLTQTEVAARMETTQSTVSNFERIGGNPTLGTIQRYARAVGARARFSIVINHSWIPLSVSRRNPD
jgi:transcriptional regulator with XRE-family HTH domain